MSPIKPFNLIKDISRAQQILSVFIKYGFSDLIRTLPLPNSLTEKLIESSAPETSEWSPAKRVRCACEELGPTFTKLGQILSTRPDVLEAEWIEEFKRLRDLVEPLDHPTLLDHLNAILGKEWGHFFSSIEQKPIGSASIAQVHKAVTKKDRTTVALKIRRPGIEDSFQSDLEIIGWLVDQVHEHLDSLASLDLPSLFADLKEALLEELDFRSEAENIQRFEQLNTHQDEIESPAVHQDLSNKKLLVLQYIEGSTPEQFDGPETLKKQLASKGTTNLMRQILEYGFYHGDPHPGNILIRPEGKLVLIDWGSAGFLTREERWTLADLLKAVVDRDVQRMLQLAHEMNESKAEIDEQRLEKELSLLFMSGQDTLVVGQAGATLFKIARLFNDSGARLSRHYTLLIKAIMSVEETGRCLDSDFDIATVAKPFLQSIQRERLNPKRLWTEAWQSGSETFNETIQLPVDLRKLLKRMDRGELEVRLKVSQFETIASHLTQAINRVVLGLIIGALIIGSSMIVTTGVGPKIWGYPQLGLFGYTLSALFGIWVAIDIVRESRANKKK